MKEETCCFSGHRIISDEKTDELKEKVYKTCENLVNRGYSRFISGGAIGFDILAAICVLALKKKYPDIKLCIYVPCKDQDAKWNTGQKTTYRYVMEHADEVEIMHETYVTGCMQERNKKMVDDSSVCVAYLTRAFGGTKSTVKYAQDCDLEVIYI